MNNELTDAKVTEDLEKVADAVFSGEAVEGMEDIANPPVATVAEETPPADLPKDEIAAKGDAAEFGDAPPDEPPKEGETAPVDDAAKKAADEAAAKEKPVPIEEQAIPEDIKDKTRERMETLISRVKDRNTELDKTTTQLHEATERLTAFQTLINDTGLENTEVLQILELGTLLKTDPGKAFDVLQGVVTSMAKDLGRPLPGVDLLEGFPDLQERVKSLAISPEDAEVIAAARRKDARETRVRDTQQQQEQTAKQSQDAIFAAANRVRAFLTQAEKDVDYVKIAPMLTKAAAFAAENLDASKWEVYIKEQYTRIKETASMAAPAVTVPDTTPLIDKATQGVKNREVRTLDDLADQML